jgi:hypothetical protein
VTSVSLEAAKKRAFATGLDWPGWCRAGRDAAGALEALAAAAPRYALVAREAGEAFPLERVARFDVVEELPGSGNTEFGVPSAIGPHDLSALKPAEAKRLGRLLTGAWTVFDRVVAGAPAELRKGPRGGGRDRDKIVDHVLGAEVTIYAAKLGLRLSPLAYTDTAAVAAFRTLIVDTLVAAAGPSQAPPKGRWPARYAARRIAWHVLDHAWEIEDRTEQLSS